MKLLSLATAVIAGLVFWQTGFELRDLPRPENDPRLHVRLPAPLQLAYAGSDPYLAANLNVFRSIMVDSRITEQETYRIQAQLQLDAALFNPRHEDNYYIAAAILPWNGYVAEAQQILRLASGHRPWDWMPPFYYAFDAWYFEQKMSAAGQWADIAADRAGPRNARALHAMAAKWYAQGDDPRLARGLIIAMHDESPDKELRRQLQLHIQRLTGLIALRDAHAAYMELHGTPPRELEQLKGFGKLQALPKDPAGFGYTLNDQGMPRLRFGNEKTDEPN